MFPGNGLMPGDLNLLVVTAGVSTVPFEAPTLIVDGSVFALDEEKFEVIQLPESGEVDAVFPIPPQFGAPTDLIQSWPSTP